MLSDRKNTFQAKQWLDKCYSDPAPSETTVKRWYADFKRGRTDTNDAKRSGHPILTVVPENTKKKKKKKLKKLILADRKLMLREVVEELKITEGCVYSPLCTNICQRESCVQSGCRSKTTRRRFRALFATVSTQQE